MQGLVSHLWAFCTAIVWQWLTLLGGAIAVVIDLVRRFGKRKISRRAEYAILLVFLFIAVFKAWDVQYSKTIPGIRLTFDGFGISTAPMTNGAAISVFLSATNVGPPSIANNWGLTIITTDNETYKFNPDPVTSNTPIQYSLHDGRTFTYEPSDVIYKKTASVPIAQGGSDSGFLVFLLPRSLARERIQLKGTIFRITCKDVFNNEIHSDLVYPGFAGTGFMPFVPGMSDPTIR